MDIFSSISVLPILRASLIDRPALATLKELCAKVRAETIVEIGSFLGMGSTQMFYRTLPSHGRLYCVDTFCVDMERFNRHQDAHYHVFLSNIKQTGLADKVVPVRMTSLEASRALDVKADLVFIDANHAESAVLADISAWLPRVKSGGILCGDDYNTPTCPGVPLAVKRALPQHHASGRIWWIQVEAPG